MEKRPLLRPTDKRGKQPPTDFVSCFENAWERPLGQCVSDSHPYMSEAKIEVNDRWIQCSAQVRLHTERKGDSISLFEISAGIGWRANCMQQHCYDVLNEDMVLVISRHPWKCSNIKIWLLDNTKSRFHPSTSIFLINSLWPGGLAKMGHF